MLPVSPLGLSSSCNYNQGVPTVAVLSSLFHQSPLFVKLTYTAEFLICMDIVKLVSKIWVFQRRIPLKIILDAIYIFIQPQDRKSRKSFPFYNFLGFSVPCIYLVLFIFQRVTLFVGSPIWKPRDQGGPDWDGSGSEASEPRRPPRGQRSSSPGPGPKTVGFESPENNGKKETLQSACKRK